MSLPIKTVSQPISFSINPAACPILKQTSGVILDSTGPRIPSVPNFIVMEKDYNSSAGPFMEVFLDVLLFGALGSSQSLGALGLAPAIMSSI